MNGYSLSRQYWDWAWDNPTKNSPTHAALYLYLVEVCNRLGWKKEFGITSKECMESIGVSSYNTFKKSFDTLLDAGLIKMVRKSKNQHQANIIALSKFDRATNGALSNFNNATTKHVRHSLNSKNNKNNKGENEVLNKKFTPPTLEEVSTYAVERGRSDLTKQFFDYYNAGSWNDKEGKPVKNWRQRFTLWENRNPKPQQAASNIKILNL